MRSKIAKSGSFTKESFDRIFEMDEEPRHPSPMILVSPIHKQHEPYVRLLSDQWEKGYIKPENCPLMERCLDFRSLNKKKAVTD